MNPAYIGHNENSNRRARRTPRFSQSGMSMIELLIAMTVLAVGMGGMIVVFATAIGNNSRAKTDTTATMLSQTVLDRIAAQPATAPNPFVIQDCNPNGVANWTVATAAGGAALSAADPSSIDWGQAYGAIAANYKMLYVACGNNGRQMTYDVRWNIQALTGNSRLITVSARPAAAAGGSSGQVLVYAQPVTLRSIGGV